MATSPLPSQGPTRRRNCYAPRAFSWLSHAKKREKIRSGYLTPAFSGAYKTAQLLRNPCILRVPNPKNGDKTSSGYLTHASGGPRRGPTCYITPAFAGIPNPKSRVKMRSSYLNPAFSGAQKSAEFLCNPCILGGSPMPTTGTKSHVATSPLPYRGTRRGRNCYATPTFLGVPNAKNRDKIRSGNLTPTFSGA